jgi:hypothetical protein
VTGWVIYGRTAIDVVGRIIGMLKEACTGLALFWACERQGSPLEHCKDEMEVRFLLLALFFFVTIVLRFDGTVV